MAKLKLIIQAITSRTHADEIRHLLALSDPQVIVMSVAFVRQAGLLAIEKSMKPWFKKTKVFVGIRNDISSIQAVQLLISWGVTVYVVDTASRKSIFHPKLYIAANRTRARAVVGSANLTFNGLHNNIEISTLVDLDRDLAEDQEFIQQIMRSFEQLPIDHPKHVFQVKTSKQANDLFAEGRLVDENMVFAPSANISPRTPLRDDLGPMLLSRVSAPRRASASTPSKGKSIRSKATKLSVVGGSVVNGYYKVWESKPLSERDLNIPKKAGMGTNPTGSMGFKKGLYDHIEHRHHFRDVIFDGLVWNSSTSGKMKEQAAATFTLVIKNLNYGAYTLKVSHNLDVASKSYAQGNMMTELHWGEAKPQIAKPDLLGRNLTLYRKDSAPPEYLIEID